MSYFCDKVRRAHFTTPAAISVVSEREALCVGLSGWSEGKKDPLLPIPSPLSYLSILAFSPSFPTLEKSQPRAKRSLVDICQICQGKSHVQNIWRGERNSFSDAYVTATNLCDIGRCHSPSLQTGRVGNSKKGERDSGS